MEEIKDETYQNNEIVFEYYPGSWIDHLNAWVARRSGKIWRFYLFLSIFLFVVVTIVFWIESGAVVTTALAFHLFFSILLPFLLGFVYYLDEMAERSLEGFRPVLTLSDREYEQLRYRFTTLPAVPAFLAGLAMLILMILVDVFLGLPTALGTVTDTPISFALIYTVYKVSTFVFGTFIYHTIHQLHWVNQTYRQYAHIDLFDLGPLYAFSRLTALTAGGIILIMYIWFAINPGTFTDLRALALGSIFVAIALFTFMWPLRSAHTLLKTEKERLLGECSSNFKVLSQELHKRIQANDLEEIGQINAAMGGLETERNAIKRISTWPWQPETLRTLVSSILAPIAIWLLQYFFRTWFGGTP